ncbi:YraN family protein [Paenibacillus forsythiae]|nr:YraN family protein [Paenibacillus forsythiae]
MHYSRKQKGRAAEEAAALYLGAKGYAIVERNWRCRTGEIDIVAEKGGCLIFIEVRSRSGHLTQGTPEESVDAPKMDQVRRTAGVYLHINGQGERPVSFDVITVMLNRDLSIASLNHICDAF